jgi:serine protease Do
MLRIKLLFIFILLTAGPVSAQRFDFDKIIKRASEYTVSVTVQIEFSLGTQSTETRSRGIGTIVSSDGLILFDGIALDDNSPFSLSSGMRVNVEPKSIEIAMMDGTKYPARFIGVDQFTKIGFCKIISDKKIDLKYLIFKQRNNFRAGEWLANLLLMPEFVSPSLAGDIGMVSALIKTPEEFVFTVGFNELGMASVLYDSTGAAIGVLGQLEDPASGGMGISQMYQSSSSDEFLPLLGVIGADRLEKLIKEPPVKGKIKRGWLGVYLQALTDDIADFWGLKPTGGIIINEVAKDSPADSAGIKTGDIIAKINGQAIEVNKEENLLIFQRQIAELGTGARVDFGILRRHDGAIDTINISAVLAPSPLTPSEAPDYKDNIFELTLRDMVFADYNIYNLDRREFKGVVVKELEAGGLAAVGELNSGDIIQAIGGEKITSVQDAEQVMKRIAETKPKEVIFFIWRDNKTTFVNVKTDW